MEIIEVRTQPSYQVVVGAGAIKALGARVRTLVKGRKAALLADSHVMPLYGASVSDLLSVAGFTVTPIEFAAGEASKTPEVLLEVIDALAAAELTRADVLVALGGGVTGDLGGLAASLYLRGIHLVQIPTSLLAMVDSSVGGKTAVNLAAGKNLLGTFYQPDLVLCDPTLLSTLPAEEFANGWAEIIKYAILEDKPLLSLVEHYLEGDDLTAIIATAIRIKEALVAEDEHDRGARALLNLGHTMGHAIERLTDFAIPHGRAVGIGLAMMTRAAVATGQAEPAALEVVLRLLARFGLEDRTTLTVEALIAACAHDKKSTGEEITVIVPHAPGHCTLERVSYATLAAWMTAAREMEDANQ